MSKIQATPFIEKLIGTLTEPLKADLTDLINGTQKTPTFRSLINSENYITNSDLDKVQFVILETYNKNYTGYLIYNASYCVLLSFQANTQELLILTINPATRVYRLVREPLSILELRYTLSSSNGGGTTIEVSNITNIASDVLDELKAGDTVLKQTGNMVHAYNVSYKENGQGICLTYADASVVETVSYDYVGSEWVYNSTDVTPLNGVNVVELSNLSGTLTDSEFAKVSSNNCIIKVGTQTFYKEFDASTLITYQAFSRQAGQDQALYEYVEITKADKSWELKNENIVEANPSVPEGTTPTDLTGVKIGAGYFQTQSLPYLTTAPTGNNTNGNLIVVVLNSEPATYYNGYLYLISESVA